LGFEVQEAGDGAEGLQVAASFRPDLILIDLIMPGLDGYAAVPQIRQQPGLEDVIILAISASAFPEDREKSIGHGSDAFIPKPVQFEELTSAIETHLHLKPIYEETKPGIPGQTVTSAPFFAPPPELAKDLVESAAEGRIVDLRADINRLELLDGQYDPLVAELRRLADGYEFAAIGELLATTADESDKHGK
jgi:CheY-like chemotaxis protein